MDPIVAARVTPFVNARYAAACRGACTPCYSLVRRYLPGERRSHEPHHDEHALVTVVVSLADSGAEYAGGLYVVGGEGERLYLGLDRGDAAVHASELHHGVHVLSGTRWSWILWYRDSETCDDLSATWFEACAHDGNPICEALHASKAASPRDPGAHLRWHERAAGHGLAGSMLKLGRASLKRLPSTLAYDAGVAAAWFRRGVEQADPECAFALAQMLVANETAAARGGSYATRLAEAVSLLEEAAAKGHTFAAYNLGVAHLFGFAEMDAELAAGWFTASGLPEGLHLASLYHAARGNADEAERTMDMAVKVGHHAPWRDAARERTGSGGSGGVSLYSSWPDACATEAVRHVPQKASEGPT
ncbi:hypothetical protein M885DRAFT_445509 [Pelagophyceae sp. CCMP2097]|nr:hypothetical protein M885DRAFT_445509 [Pelagophyceae sp. CCMP2097]